MMIALSKLYITYYIDSNYQTIHSYKNSLSGEVL